MSVKGLKLNCQINNFLNGSPYFKSNYQVIISILILSCFLISMQLGNEKSNILLDVGENEIITYRKRNFLEYPINVGRNIARQEANSYFVFPCDIELYPTPGMIISSQNVNFVL